MMNSIIKEFDGKDKTDGPLVVEQFSPQLDFVKELALVSIPGELIKLLGLPDKPDISLLMLLFQPWQRANLLINLLESFDLSVEKSRVKQIIKEINALEKSLRHWPRESLRYLLLLTSSGLDLDRFLIHLTELKAFLSEFSELDFGNGQAHNPDYLKRYAIDSLFWMGKGMGLSEKGRPTQLNEYISIVTGRSCDEVAKDHFKYNKQGNFLLKYEQQEHFILQFIFNPDCIITEDALRAIRTFNGMGGIMPDTP